MCNDNQVELSYIHNFLDDNEWLCAAVDGCPEAIQAFCSRLPPDDLSLFLDPYSNGNIERQLEGFIEKCNNTQIDLAFIDNLFNVVPNLRNIVNSCPAAVVAYLSKLSTDTLSVFVEPVSKQSRLL